MISLNISRRLLAAAVLLATLFVGAARLAYADELARVDAASWLIKEGAKAYYQVYGTWPDSWAAVVESGLVQVPLYALNGKEIDPDDGKWDFEYDIQYMPPNDGKTPKLGMVTLMNGQYVILESVEPVLSYAEKYSSSDSQEIKAVLGDELRLKQWAIGGMLQRSLFVLYNVMYNEQPASFAEFISAGVTGIDCCSINPLTGTYFAGDGSPNDFKFYARTEDGEVTGNNLYATDGAGETPWTFMY